jgi:NTP pyrophosphatase (non-canonical NTP hydrolase)
MNFEQYQKEAQRTIPKDFRSRLLANLVIGLNEEAGEVASPIKKHLFHGHELDRYEVIDEMGDVLWYLNNLATTLEIDMREVADRNILKLMNRYPDGFSHTASINRKEGI